MELRRIYRGVMVELKGRCLRLFQCITIVPITTFLLLLNFPITSLYAQEPESPAGSLQFTGAIQHESLFPTTDISADRTHARPDWAKIDHLSNSYLDLGLNYSYYKSNALGFTGLNSAVRMELLEWPMLGYERDFKGHGIGHLHLTSNFKWGSVTLGDVYAQFGTGLILRLYEERALGVDNALRGAKIVLKPYKGIYFEALGGKQRRYWNCYDDHAWGFNYKQDAVLGANLELGIEQWSEAMQNAGAYLTIGGSYVSKYEQLDSIYCINEGQLYMYNLPQWVGAGEVRANFQMKGWDAMVEYAYKANDPCFDNRYSYKHGEALLASLSYSQKGMSVIVQAKRSENMTFRSERTRTGTAAFINHLPAFANQHTYALPALYPYATQMAGEWAFQGELRYTWKRGTKMGGKYGTTLKLNASHIMGLRDSQNATYYTDINLELNKKLTKQWYIAAMLMYQTYNKQVVEGHGDLIRSGIGVFEVQWATTKNVQMRAEMQYLYTPHDDGQWIYALYELALYKQLTLTASEQYCIGGSPASTEQGSHYYSFLATWQHQAHRLTLGYTKTRAGYNCAGGVCRYVPKQEGVTLTYNYAW